MRQSSRSTPPLPGPERRLAPRRRVRGGFAQFRLAHVDLLDASPHGMSIELHQGLPIGARYRFKLRQSSATVEVDALVRWCRLVATLPSGPGERVPVYRAGLSFTAIRSAGEGYSVPHGDRAGTALAVVSTSSQSPSQATSGVAAVV